MFWTKEILNKLNVGTPQLINDSKTPSGDPHVGSLRGVLIHDAIYKTLRKSGFDVKYTFGSDDYDPVDEIPKGQDEHFSKYLGMPLCNVPPPPGSTHTDMAEHFISGFFKTFDELGVEAERYRMRDIYRSGQFNEAIDQILSKHNDIRAIYKEISGSEKSEHWYPFQTICENCGKIGTTEVIDYDGKEVTYICHENLVKWAKGCGHKGKMSPFDGNGKMPWKMEWVAKWMVMGITIEGAGMDHSTKGGSRDVAATVLRKVFGKNAPFNVPYGFFLVEGAKMSSSKGIGATAREMNEFLSPEVLRYLMLATVPKRAINFSPTEQFIVKLFNDFDTTRHACYSGKDDTANQADLFTMSDLDATYDYFLPSFSLVKTMIQLPHIDILKATESMKGEVLSDLEIKRLKHRIDSAQYWLKYYAEEDEKFSIQAEIPSDSNTVLTNTDKAFLLQFAKDLQVIDWIDHNIQQQVFDSSRLIPTLPKESFKAVYKIFLNKEKGPTVGSLLSYLDKDFVINRLNEVNFDLDGLWNETVLDLESLESFLTKEGKNFTTIQESLLTSPNTDLKIKELLITKEDGQKLVRRTLVEVDLSSFKDLFPNAKIQ